MSLEEKYDEVRQLIETGKEKGFLLYDEVNELLPADITTSVELDELFTAFGNAGIEVVDSEEKYRERKLLDRRTEGSDDVELDLTPSAIDKTNDPVRMYLREMGTVPLLTREGEVEIAKRIERAKLSIIKAVSRTPTIAKAVIRMGEQLKDGDRTIRELAIFHEDEVTDRSQSAAQVAAPVSEPAPAGVHGRDLGDRASTAVSGPWVRSRTGVHSLGVESPGS